MKQPTEQFNLSGEVVLCEPYGSGHINDTYRVVTDTGAQYILQRVNTHVFPDVNGLMDNIARVTSHLAAQAKNPRETMHLVPAKDGAQYYTDAEGDVWRVYDFVENSLCLQKIEVPADFFECGLAFGNFQRMMADFPAETLCETIVNFHNTPDRYNKLKRAIAADNMGRAVSVREEIAFALSFEQEAGQLHRMRTAGELPTRVTHNDTKINNVLFDRYSKKALCVIDLDTVMPGLAAYDFGDSIRFGAATAADALLQLVPQVAPATEVVPVVRPVAGGAEQDEKALSPAGLHGFERVLVVGPGPIAEDQPQVRAGAGLDELTVLDRPAARRVLLEAAVPHQLAPQPAVGRVVDVLEKMPVDLLVDAVQHLPRIDRRRQLAAGGAGDDRQGETYREQVTHGFAPFSAN